MKVVVVTGSSGGIGQAICDYFYKIGIAVVGIDSVPSSKSDQLLKFIQCDFAEVVAQPNKQNKFKDELLVTLSGYELLGLVNNAAVQLLGGIQNTSVTDFKTSLDVNVVAPFMMVSMLYEKLALDGGGVVNIGSIHSRLTKPGFISYATSKSALQGLTQSLAVDCGSQVRVNSIQPAAIATDMLLAGFDSKKEKLEDLKAYHPSGMIGRPADVAETVAYLLIGSPSFMNGTAIDLNGGIGSRLHDPA